MRSILNNAIIAGAKSIRDLYIRSSIQRNISLQGILLILFFAYRGFRQKKRVSSFFLIYTFPRRSIEISSDFWIYYTNI